MNKLTFNEMNNICTVLGTFADARLKAIPDKDVIMEVQTIDGKDLLVSRRLSQMSWGSRFVRYFGYGGATLTAVAAYLRKYEPYLAKKSALLAGCGEDLYTADAFKQLKSLDKAELKKLRAQKVRGCEVFKRCLAHHNQNSRFPVYILLQDWGKRSLKTSYLSSSGIEHQSPNPMTPTANSNEDALRNKYKAPKIDPAEQGHLSPFFKGDGDLRDLSPQALGFCYHHGIGVKKDLAAAEAHYRKAADNDEYSACYNLGVLILNSPNREAISGTLSLLKAEQLLLEKIALAKPHKGNEGYVRKYQRALVKVYTILISACITHNIPNLKDKYQGKLNSVNTDLKQTNL